MIDLSERQDGLALLREAVTEYYGERCEDYEPGCACCDAWAAVDQFKVMADALDSMERDAGLGEGNMWRFWSRQALGMAVKSTQLSRAADAAKFYKTRAGELEAALKSIAANTCCDTCQEAALVAKHALKVTP